VTAPKETTLGGSRFRFGETLWTRVLAAKAGAPEALDQLVRAYWKPIYYFIRRRGSTVENAKDLAQGFFAMVLERQALKGVDPAKGKFKTFLLTLLERFLANERERANAKKRGGTKVVVPLEEAAELGMEGGTPEEAFERAWGETVLARAFDRMRGELHFDVLDLHLSKGLGVTEIGKTLGRKPKEVENALGRARKRFKEAVLGEVLEYVSSEAEAEEEIRQILGRLR
jgi:RNA polymerase sigma factor (sigma-70 family)